RFVADYGLTPRDAGTLTSSRALADFFEAALGAAGRADARQTANWVANDLAGKLADRSETVDTASITPRSLAELLDRVAEGTISQGQGKTVLDEMLATGKGAGEIVEEKGLRQVSDAAELEGVVDKVIAENNEAAEKVRGGDEAPLKFLIGQVMRATRGQANPSLVNEILRQRLGI
ncbi:MAG: Asp-tRNA(Asn)/Glu-tRNA(Gln) amidotransferase subunit GatB, partial [Actinomycetota bacterium]